MPFPLGSFVTALLAVLLTLLWFVAGSGWAILAAIAAAGVALGVFIGHNLLALLRGR